MGARVTYASHRAGEACLAPSERTMQGAHHARRHLAAQPTII